MTDIVAGLQKHAELLEPYSRREAAAAEYVRAVRPGLEVHTGELHDAKVQDAYQYLFPMPSCWLCLACGEPGSAGPAGDL